MSGRLLGILSAIILSSTDERMRAHGYGLICVMCIWIDGFDYTILYIWISGLDYIYMCEYVLEFELTMQEFLSLKYFRSR